MKFDQKLVLISGGSRGIGLALAQKFAQNGANVVIAARDADKLIEAENIIRKSFRKNDQFVVGFQLDVTQDSIVTEVIGEMIQKHGCPDFLVNSAGYAHPGDFGELSMDIFRKTMDVNYFGTVNMTRALINPMLKRGSGHIVNISSVSGFLGIYGYTAYSGSKFAVTGFSDSLRNEMKPRGIRVSVVFPPDTDTEQLAYESKLKPEVTRKMAGNAGLLTAEQVSSAILTGIEKNRYIITPGFEPSLFYFLTHFTGKLPFWVLDLMAVDEWKKLRKS